MSDKRPELAAKFREVSEALLEDFTRNRYYVFLSGADEWKQLRRLRRALSKECRRMQKKGLIK